MDKAVTHLDKSMHLNFLEMIYETDGGNASSNYWAKAARNRAASDVMQKFAEVKSAQKANADHIMIGTRA